jgi:sugar phosphate isomerase/epimerase
MKLSTTLNPFVLPYNRGMAPYYEELENYKQLGFPILDCIFCNADWAGSPLLTSRWQEWGEKLAEKSRELGIVYEQCHMPYYNFTSSAGGVNEATELLVERSIAVASMLGAKWIVSHPATAFAKFDMVRASKEENLRYFSRCMELGQRHGIGIAIENMADFPGQGYRRSYCATVEELCDLVDSLGRETGICWDFGHANLVYHDQVPCLEYLGRRLKATHVHDNHGQGDEHLPLFFGNIKWTPLMRKLVEIEYSGVFSFEIKRIDVNLPKEIRNAQWKYAKITGEYLLSLAEPK